MKTKTILLILVCAAFVLTCAKKDDQSNTDRQYVTASGGLNMRNAPQTGAQAVLLIPQNAEVTVLERAGEEVEIGGRKGKWTKVRYNSQEGWVFGGFLADERPASDQAQSGSECANSLKGFTSGCLGSSCEAEAVCGDKMEFRPGGVFALVYCDGGSIGTWRMEGQELIAETETKMSEGTECFAGAEHHEAECKAQAARDYAGIVNKSKTVITINPDGSVYEVTTIQRSGQSPVVSQGVRKGCLMLNRSNQ